MIDIILCLTILLLFLIAVFGVTCTLNNTIYSYFFEKEEWKKWKEFIDLADKFEFAYKVDNDMVFVYENYDATIWGDRDMLCSIHTKTDQKCICSTFIEFMSRKMSDILLNKLNDK